MQMCTTRISPLVIKPVENPPIPFHLSPSDSISRPAVSLLIATELDGLQPGVEQVGVRQHRPGAHPPQEAVGAGPAHVQQVGRSLSARGRCARREGGRVQAAVF